MVLLSLSAATNWYECAPTTSENKRGSLTGWTSGPVDCSVVKHNYECGNVVPIKFSKGKPKFKTDINASNPFLIYYDGRSDNFYPTHDPCGNNTVPIPSSIVDPVGAIYLR